jgi:hypothetical protein
MATQNLAVACPIKPRGKVYEKRRAPRALVIKSAIVVFDSDYCSMNCLVLDLSETGARLQPADILVCPDQFTLKFPNGPVHFCEVRWRKGNMLGVRLL